MQWSCDCYRISCHRPLIPLQPWSLLGWSRPPGAPPDPGQGSDVLSRGHRRILDVEADLSPHCENLEGKPVATEIKITLWFGWLTKILNLQT